MSAGTMGMNTCAETFPNFSNQAHGGVTAFNAFCKVFGGLGIVGNRATADFDSREVEEVVVSLGDVGADDHLKLATADYCPERLIGRFGELEIDDRGVSCVDAKARRTMSYRCNVLFAANSLYGLFRTFA